jgi:hypothetical protein
MSKVLFAISLMTLLACGSGDSDTGTADSAADAQPVSAAASASKKAAPAKVEEAETRGGEQAKMDAVEISSCISLVASAKFEEAVPVCLKAASIDAENAEVQAALAKAQAETAKEAAAGAASDAAGEAAADALGGLGN